MKLLAGLCAVAVTFVLPPAVAAADPDPVGVGVARASDYQRGTFDVPAWTDAAGATISAVKATIRNGAATVTTVDLVAEETPGHWAPASPLRLIEDGGSIDTLGRYAIDVTATDSDGNSATRVDAGTLDFTMRPEFDTSTNPYGIGFTRSTLDRAHQSIGATGVLLGVQPGSLDRVPLAGRTVSVTRSYDDVMPNRVADTTVEATTDSQGRFSTDEAPQVWWASYRSRFTADDAEVHGTAEGYGQPAITTTAVTVSAKTDRARVEPGQKVTISGSVRIGSAPVVGVQVNLVLGSYGSNGEPQVTVTTDGNGNFSGAITAVSAPYWVSWSAATFDPYVTGSASGQITVPAEASYSAVSIVLDSYGRVTGRGTLARTYAPEQAIYQPQSTYLQYSPDGKSGWRNLTHGRFDPYTPIRLTAGGYVDGYYRLYHPTSDELAHTYSAVVHRSRIPTRIAGNNAGPEPVKVGRTVTVTGTLQEYRSRAWRAFAHRHVELWFLAKGAKRWTYVGSGTTDSRGRATLRGKATKDGRWLIQYFGDSTHFDSVGTSDYVDAR